VSDRRERARLVGIIAASGISILGSRMSFVAIPWLVLVTTGSPARMGLVAGAEMLPYVLASSLGAPLVDRMGPRRTAIGTDLGSAVVMVAVATAYSAGFGLLLLLVAVAGGLRGFADNAKKVLVPPRAKAADVALPQVIAAFEAMSRFSMMVGAVVAGVLIAWVGAPAAIVVDAASFVVAAVLVVLSVRPSAPGGPAAAVAAPKEPYLTALRGGFGHVWGDRIMFAIFAMLFGINLLNQAAGVVLVPLWADSTVGSAAAVGVVLGALGLGAVLGSVGFTMVVTKVPRYAVFTLGFLLGGPPRFVVLGVSDDVLTVAVVWFLSGVALTAINPTIGSMVVERTPPELHARVFGLNTAVAWAGIPLGGVFAGWAVAAFGLAPALLLSAAVYLAIALVPVVGYRAWRSIGRRPDPPEVAAGAGAAGAGAVGVPADEEAVPGRSASGPGAAARGRRPG
jgi:predicted MFS family arabinose efflux permease